MAVPSKTQRKDGHREGCIYASYSILHFPHVDYSLERSINLKTLWSVLSAFYACRIEDLPAPTKKLTPELTPVVLFTGFEPTQVHQYIKVASLYF